MKKYTNHQYCSLNSNLPVQQRRFGFLLQKHPKKYKNWSLVNTIFITEMPTSDIREAIENLVQRFVKDSLFLHRELDRRSEAENEKIHSNTTNS